jgi:hypothetical protein
MFEARQLGALIAIAAGGVLNAGLGAQFETASPETRPVAAARAEDPVQAAARAAMLAQLRADLGDASATLDMAPLSFSRSSGRSLEGRGTAFVRFDGSAPLPLDVSVVWDLPTQRVEQASWLVAGPAAGEAIDAATRRRIADRIGARLVLEFAGQPVDFALSRVEHMAAGRGRLLVSGEGVTDFGSEGAARTRFVATAERGSGKLLTLQYELGEQLAQ